MMNLKLAQYNLETGKFEKFLELGKDFLFGGDFIVKASVAQFPDGIIVRSWYVNEHFTYKKDEKDPLNRFDGLFDGITYGNGEFVLEKKIKDRYYSKYSYAPDTWQSDVLHYRKASDQRSIDEKMVEALPTDYFLKQFQRTEETVLARFFNWVDSENDILFHKNLHENPELWEKVK